MNFLKPITGMFTLGGERFGHMRSGSGPLANEWLPPPRD